VMYFNTTAAAPTFAADATRAVAAGNSVLNN
jgi:hypothetical protein